MKWSPSRFYFMAQHFFFFFLNSLSHNLYFWTYIFFHTIYQFFLGFLWLLCTHAHTIISKGIIPELIPRNAESAELLFFYSLLPLARFHLSLTYPPSHNLSFSYRLPLHLCPLPYQIKRCLFKYTLLTVIRIISAFAMRVRRCVRASY